MMRLVIEQLLYAVRGAAEMFRSDPHSWGHSEYHWHGGQQIASTAGPHFGQYVGQPGWQHCAMGGIDVMLNRNGSYSLIDGLDVVSIDHAVGQELWLGLVDVPRDTLYGNPLYDNIIYFNDTDHCEKRHLQRSEHALCVADSLSELADGLEALYEWQSELEGYKPMEDITVAPREEVMVSR